MDCSWRKGEEMGLKLQRKERSADREEHFFFTSKHHTKLKAHSAPSFLAPHWKRTFPYVKPWTTKDHHKEGKFLLVIDQNTLQIWINRWTRKPNRVTYGNAKLAHTRQGLLQPPRGWRPNTHGNVMPLSLGGWWRTANKANPGSSPNYFTRFFSSHHHHIVFPV